MRVAVLGFGHRNGIEAPDSIPPFNLVRQTLRHQPVEYAIQRHAVEFQPMFMCGSFYFLMTQGSRCREQNSEHLLTRRRAANTGIKQSCSGQRRVGGLNVHVG